MSQRKSPLLTFALACAGAIALSATSSSTADAQIFQKMKDAAKKKAAEKAAEAVVGKPAETPATAAPTPAGAPAAASTDAAPAGRTEWANYDFVPGSTVLFATDFSDDQVGNFPKRLDFKTGAMEVVELDGKRALKASSNSVFIVPLPSTLPQKFTVEIGVINRNSKGVASTTLDVMGGKDINDRAHTQVGWGHNGLYVGGGGVEAMSMPGNDAYVGKPATFRILADGSALKLYADGKRLANIPNANFLRDRAIVLQLGGRDDAANAVYVTSIRVAESEKSIYDELTAKGRWATQGILFDVGQSTVKPESTPTLKQIAEVLKQNPSLKVEIAGNTDNVGSAAANLTLSDARANAVKDLLVSEYGVQAEQLTAKGYGSTKPVGPNTTPEGRANNRRVELVKK
jgi:outer membrane protein OmpA-like peptidoglycan-associated protein